MKYYSYIIWRHTAKRFILSFLALLTILLAIVYMFDVIELLRRAAKYDGVGFNIVTYMAFLKLPEVGQMLLPFAVLFSAMYCFYDFNRKSELAIIKSSGMSIWYFLAPALITAFLIGVITITILNPLSSILLKKYQSMEEEYMKQKSYFVTLLQNGLWLRQNDPEGYALIYAKKFTPHDWGLNMVIVFTFDNHDNFLQRIDGKTAELKEGYWNIKDVTIHRDTQIPEKLPNYRYPTNLTKK